MIAGRPPFKEGTDYLTMKKIQEGSYQFPEGFDPVVRTLVEGCLVVDPTHRITSGALKEHPFFESINWDTIWKESPPILASGLVRPPERHDEDINIHLNLTWTMDGSEDEMEDLRPPPDFRHRQESTIPLPSTQAEPAREASRDSSPTESRKDSEITPTRARDENKLPFGTSSSPANLASQLRRFSSERMERKSSVPFDDSAAIFSPTEETPGKGRRFSTNSEIHPRPRRMSPSSVEGTPAKPRPHSEGLQEGEEEVSSEQWSAESPPSTLEHLESNPAAQGKEGLAHDKSISTISSADVGLMSTSGTSRGSGTSGGIGKPSKGFERIRGAKGVELEQASTLSGDGWILTNGYVLSHYQKA